MSEALSIYEAKTNFSKLVKRAAKGETIYVGAYGKIQAVIAPPDKKRKLNLSVLEGKFDGIDDEAFTSLDTDVQKLFFDKAPSK